jgi:hypothetical protein
MICERCKTALGIGSERDHRFIFEPDDRVPIFVVCSPFQLPEMSIIGDQTIGWSPCIKRLLFWRSRDGGSYELRQPPRHPSAVSPSQFLFNVPDIGSLSQHRKIDSSPIFRGRDAWNYKKGLSTRCFYYSPIERLPSLSLLRHE